MTKQIKYFIEGLIPKEHLWKIKLFTNWDSIMGPLKDKVTIEQIKEGTLFLGVVHPAWAQELFLLSQPLKQRINACLEQERIKVIRFVFIDKSKKSAPISKLYFNKNQTTNSSASPLLTHQEEQRLRVIKDQDLRVSLEKFYVRCKKTRESR